MKKISVDFSQKTDNKLKPVNGICNGPLSGNKDFSEDYIEMQIPFVRLHDTGYGSMPYYVDISAVFPNFAADENDPASYFFQHTDQLLNAIDQVGAQTIYRLGESIDHTIFKRHARPPQDFAKWSRICINIIRHYNDGWADGFRLGIQYWEIWNEPDVGSNSKTSAMWADGTQEQAFDLYRQTARAIKQYDKTLKVGGMAFTSFNLYSRQFIDLCAAEKLPLDFYSFHSYFHDIEALARSAQTCRDYLNQKGFAAAEIIFDEWNYFWDEYEGNLWIGCRQDPVVAERLYTRQKTEVGASFVAASFIAMNSMPIDIAAYYDGQYRMNWCGLYNHYGARQKTFYAFKAYGLMYAADGTIVKTDGGMEGDGIYALAVDCGQVRYVLISNYRGTSGSVHVELSGLASSGTTADLYLIDRTFNLERYRQEYYHGQKIEQTICLDKHSVALIKIS
ncbi:MAG: glycosyl hydrolase [Bacillota bacterium]|nr:glycosyl hydrolase [Bacillota bacterium]